MKRLSKRALLTTAVLVSISMARPLSAQMASHAPTALATQASPAPAAQATPVAAGQVSPAPAVTGKPVARVNGVVMTDRDLLREMYAIFPYARQHNGFPKSMEPEIRKGALQMVIFEELVYQEAQRQRTPVPDDLVSRSLVEFKKKFRSQADYQSYLQAEASGSERVVKDRVRRGLVIDAYLKAKVQDKSAVSLAEARAYYDKHPEHFAYKESFLFQSISIMPPETANPEAMQEARRRAEEALRQAKTTKSYREFGLLAERISEDDFRVNLGDHKAVERDQLPPDVVKAALAMKPGEVSDLIPLAKTFTLFRLNGHVPAGKRKFDEVKDQLRKDLQKEKEDRLRIGVDANLHKNAKIEEL
jgi:peptidyl-prolyl cis-trans isomerase SurA